MKHIMIVVSATLLAILTNGAERSALAQDCDDACFLIENTYSKDTLNRYLKQFSNGRYVVQAQNRLNAIDAIGKRDENGVGAHIVKTQKLKSFTAPNLN